MSDKEQTKSAWTLEEGIALARRLEPIAIELNSHIALGGGVLHRGSSEKDVDIFVYPRDKSTAFHPLPSVLLKAFGVSYFKETEASYKFDTKKVFFAILDGKRVDFFFVL